MEVHRFDLSNPTSLLLPGQTEDEAVKRAQERSKAVSGSEKFSIIPATLPLTALLMPSNRLMHRVYGACHGPVLGVHTQAWQAFSIFIK